MANTVLKKENLSELFAALLRSGWQVIAPVKVENETLFKEVESIDEIDWETLLPTNNPKEFLFPRTESVLQYQFTGDRVEMGDVSLALAA